MLFVIGLTLVAIFVGSHDAAEHKNLHDKYGGDALIKAISEYNEKSNSIHGYIGAAGVTRTPLSNTTDPMHRSNGMMGANKQQGNQLPAYMMNQTPGNRPASNSNGNNNSYYPPNPYMPQTHQNNGDATQQNSGANGQQQSAPADNGYYPPPPVQAAPDNPDGQQQYPPPPGPQSSNVNPGKPFVVPMTLPPQALPEDKLRLPSGQKVAFSGLVVYTYDNNGKPIPMPDGIYRVGSLLLHVRDGKKVSE